MIQWLILLISVFVDIEDMSCVHISPTCWKSVSHYFSMLSYLSLVLLGFLYLFTTDPEFFPTFFSSSSL